MATKTKNTTKTAKSAVKSAAAKKAAVTKKAKKENDIILNDEKVKDLLDAIATMTVELDKAVADAETFFNELQITRSVNDDLRKEVYILRNENIRLDSKCSDYEIEMETQRKMFTNVSLLADESVKQTEDLKSIYSDAIQINSDLRESLMDKQRELETSHINFVRLKSAFEHEKSILTDLQTKIDQKWYNRLSKWLNSGKSLGPRP